MNRLHDLLGIEPQGSLIHGTVLSVDQTNYSCRVQPDKDNIPILENVPLRVYNLQDDFGIITIPETNSPCLVGFLEGDVNLPVLLRCQRWTKIIIKKANVTEIILDPEGNVYIKAIGTIQLGPQGEHKGAWGDKWLIEFNKHIHPTPNGPSGPPQPPLQDQQVNSQKVTLD